MKKFLTVFCILCLVFTMLAPSTINAKASKTKLYKSKYTLYVGKTFKIKIKNPTCTPFFTSSKTSVATVDQYGTVTPIKSGKTTITVKMGSKKLKCKITVKVKYGSGTKASPANPYKTRTINYYEEGKKIGKFKIKLLKFVYGNSAKKLAKNNSSNPVPKDNEEYIFFKFQIKYVSGSQVIKGRDLFNYYYNVYGANSTRQLTNIDWGFSFENAEDLGLLTLIPGTNVICAKAILVEKGYAPFTYRIQTGKNSFTWFTTAK